MEKGENPVGLARRTATLNAWVGIVGAIMALGVAGHEKLYPSAASGGYLGTGGDWGDQTWHTDFEGREGQGPGLAGWFVGLKLYIF